MNISTGAHTHVHEDITKMVISWGNTSQGKVNSKEYITDNLMVDNSLCSNGTLAGKALGIHVPVALCP
jgi:hypothetical protein